MSCFEMLFPPKVDRAPAPVAPVVKVNYVLDKEMPLSVIVFGATGDLARKKLFPALYQLMLLGHFPRRLNIVGYGRSAVVMKDFLDKQCVNVKEKPGLTKAEFLQRISFHAGAYDSPEAFEALDAKLKEYEQGAPGNRLFFLSVPPQVFQTVCQSINAKARAIEGAFTHVIIEKPFGRDSASFKQLNDITASIFKESELFRIDHYLGKEIVLNLVTLRFANQIFEPLWNRDHIESVEITFKEDLGTGGRGGYFDGFGIIRDIMQNHLLQVFMFVAMEPPRSMDAAGVTEAKVALLEAVPALELGGGVCLGQFTGNSWNVAGKEHVEPGYLEDATVPAGSKCPTFAALVLKVNNKRWQGVPFLMKAGKALDERMAEVRVKFKKLPCNALMHEPETKGNELVMRIQPDEALFFKQVSKEPGLGQVIAPTVMDMRYASQFPGAYVGDAYERMFLNAAKGDGSLFVSAAELFESWRIFTPLLHQIDNEKPDVELYPFGSAAPPSFADFCKAQGVPQEKNLNWQEFLMQQDVAHLTTLFNKLDKKKKGSLGPDDARGLVKTFFDGRDPPAEKIKEFMDMLDEDGDGQLTLEEMIHAVCRFKKASVMGTAASLDHT